MLYVEFKEKSCTLLLFLQFSYQFRIIIVTSTRWYVDTHLNFKKAIEFNSELQMACIGLL